MSTPDPVPPFPEPTAPQPDLREVLLGHLDFLRSKALQKVDSLTAADGPRWDGAPPATLHRVLLHLLQEYARHLGQLDVVVEQFGGATGE